MISLGEEPAVATGRGTDLDDGGGRKPPLVEQRPGDIPLERDPTLYSSVQSGRLRDDAVRAVGSDEEVGLDALAADGGRDAVLADRDLLDPRTVQEARAGGHRLLRKVCVEPAPLGHQDQRFRARAAKAAAVVQAKLERVHDPLDDGRDVARHLAERTAGDSTAARLVPREPRAIGKENARPAAGEMDRRRRSRRPGAHDENVEASCGHGAGHWSDPGQRRTTVAVGAPVKASGGEILITTEAALFE